VVGSLMSNFRSEMMAKDLDEPGILGHLGTQNGIFRVKTSQK
jgi:hypothetical protein